MRIWHWLAVFIAGMALCLTFIVLEAPHHEWGAWFWGSLIFATVWLTVGYAGIMSGRIRP